MRFCVRLSKAARKAIACHACNVTNSLDHRAKVELNIRLRGYWKVVRGDGVTFSNSSSVTLRPLPSN